jgi:hypothetical protein
VTVYVQIQAAAALAPASIDFANFKSIREGRQPHASHWLLTEAMIADFE